MYLNIAFCRTNNIGYKTGCPIFFRHLFLVQFQHAMTYHWNRFLDYSQSFDMNRICNPPPSEVLVALSLNREYRIREAKADAPWEKTIVSLVVACRHVRSQAKWPRPEIVVHMQFILVFKYNQKNHVLLKERNCGIHDS